MNTTLSVTMNLVRAIRLASRMNTRRNFGDFFADRISQAATESTLLGFTERLMKSVDADPEYIGGDMVAAVTRMENASQTGAVLAWFREHARITAMIARLKSDDFDAAISSIVVDDVMEDDGVITRVPKYQISIMARLISPLSHGSDQKAGNSTLFRRINAMTDTGRVLSLPFYSGNALNGQMRDLLADHLTLALGLAPRRDKPPYALWFFHILYGGGGLEEDSASAKALKDLGAHGALRTDGLRAFRDIMPFISAWGAALGNRILSGRLYVGDLRPSCREWGTGTTPTAQLMDWLYLTRREDFEGWEDGEHSGMIVTTEVIKPGATLIGGLDIDSHANEIERAIVGKGLALLRERGMLGAQNRRGLGRAEISFENEPDPAPYESWLEVNRQKVVDYLMSIGALATE